MKIIKLIYSLVQYISLGLVFAAIYIFWQSDLNTEQLLTALNPDQLQLKQAPARDKTKEQYLNSPTSSYAAAVNSSSPSVVTIYTTRTTKQSSHPLLDDPVFNNLFPDQIKKRRANLVETNLGSGVIISGNGYILTNQHVIDNADQISVLLPDGRSSPAVLIGQDKDTDIAVLKIGLNQLQRITIAKSDDLAVGDVVLAIGNPLNVGQTVTMGIISATGRNRIGLNTFENFIQTDAAINPGNSGGALVNARGELIAINTAIYSQESGSQGISFAIPISLAINVMQQLVRYGKVHRGWLGVEGTEINAKAIMDTGNSNMQGVLIVGVFINSPADIAGIKAGDVIIEINEEPVSGVRNVLENITRHSPGETIEVTVMRKQEKHKFHLKLIERPQL